MDLLDLGEHVRLTQSDLIQSLLNYSFVYIVRIVYKQMSPNIGNVTQAIGFYLSIAGFFNTLIARQISSIEAYKTSTTFSVIVLVMG